MAKPSAATKITTSLSPNIDENDDDREDPEDDDHFSDLISNPTITTTRRRRRRRRNINPCTILLLSRCISIFQSLSIIGIGIALLCAPSPTISTFLPCKEEKDEINLSVLENILGKLVGATFISFGLSTILQLWLIVRKQKRGENGGYYAAIVGSQGLFGLSVLLIGIFSNYNNNDDNDQNDGKEILCEEYNTMYLLASGAVLIFLSCFAMMMYVWPYNSSNNNYQEEDEDLDSEELTLRNGSHTQNVSSPSSYCLWYRCLCCGTTSRQQQRSVDDIQSHGYDLSTPLISIDHHHHHQQQQQQQQQGQNNIDEEEANHDSFTINNNNGQTTDINDNDDEDDGGNELTTTTAEDENNTTSRITGTKRLIKLASPQMPYLYTGCLVLLIRLPFSLAIPHFVSTTLGALGQSNFTKAKEEILFLFIVGTVDAMLDFWCIFLFGYAKERVVKGVRIDLFRAILRQEVQFFDTMTCGDLSSRLVSDCESMSQDLTWFFRFSIESLVRIIGVATYMLIRSPQLGLCALSIVPVVGYINKKYGDWLRANAQSVQDALAKANSVSQETFSCIRTVIAFATEDYEQTKYESKIEKHYELNVRQLYMTGVYYMLVSTFLINTCVQSALLLLGTFLIEKDKLTAEVLLAFMLYQGQLQNETMNLFQSYTSLIKSSGAGDKVFALLDRSPPPPGTGNIEVLSAAQTSDDDDDNGDHDDHCDAEIGGGDDSSRQVVMGLNNIELCSLTFSYPSRPLHRVLDGLDLNINGGSTIALVGPSGCGKSTIIGLLERFYDPDVGAILIDGVDLRNIDIKLHRRSIGIVTQDPVLFSGSVCDNIAYGYPSATMEDIVEAAKLANAHDFISLFPDGYETEVGERGVQLSGGQKQRVAIARAIIKNPGILLLDEATSALDPESERVVQEALDHLLLLNNEMTTIIVAHRLGTVRKADCIVVVNEGSIIERGSHCELMEISNGHYRNMVERADAKGILPED